MTDKIIYFNEKTKTHALLCDCSNCKKKTKQTTEVVNEIINDKE